MIKYFKAKVEDIDGSPTLILPPSLAKDLALFGGDIVNVKLEKAPS